MSKRNFTPSGFYKLKIQKSINKFFGNYLKVRPIKKGPLEKPFLI
jgi:hypothetical protein